MTRDTDLLTRTLRDRSEQMTGTSLGLGDVKTRARGIRRRRQVMVGAVAAVVLAVAAPVGLSVTDALDPQPIPPAEQTETPNPDRTDKAGPEPEFPEQPVPLNVDGLPEGEAPGVNYIAYGKGELVTPSGTVSLPRQVGSVAAYGDGWITIGGEGPVLRWLDADGDVTRTEPTASVFLAVSDDGSQVAWTEGRFGDRQVRLVAAPTGGGEPRSWTIDVTEAEVRPVGFLGEDRLVFTIIETSRNAIAEPDGSITELEGFLSIRSASQAGGLVAVQTHYSMNRKCDGVVDPSASTSETLWTTCDYQLGEFSPDGRYVLGKVVQDDAFTRAAAVLDARTGEVLVEFVPEPGQPVVMYQIAWEDSDSLLAVTHAIKPNEGLMLRLDLDGSLEDTGLSGSFENMGSPFGFATYLW